MEDKHFLRVFNSLLWDIGITIDRELNQKHYFHKQMPLIIFSAETRREN